MKSIILILVFTATIILLPACCKVACVANYIVVDFSNFQTKEFDTLVYLGYERGSNFTILKDSSLGALPHLPNDTTQSHYITSLEINYDWIIKLPRPNKTYRFTNYNIGIDRCSCGNTKYDVLISYTVNGISQNNYVYKLVK